jgi:predicted dinucleotide-utilizing enzyme
MDAVWVCEKLQKEIKERERQISERLLNNELADMAQYRELMGEIRALGAISQDIKEILEKGNDDNVGHIVRPPAFGN